MPTENSQGFTLPNSVQMPGIGFGTWRLEGAQAVEATSQALACGYHMLDTAASYANESSVAKGVLAAGVPRENLFITGKLWNTKREYELALNACRQSLKRLKLEYLDLYLVHWPASPALHENWRFINADTWRAMETLLKEGLVRAIGVCNFLPRQLAALMEDAHVVPMVNQIEMHPGHAQAETRSFCAAYEIHLQAWAPLGEGTILANEAIMSMASRYGKTPAQLCLRWCIQNGAAPLPKTANEERMRENLNVFDFVVSDKDMGIINALPFCGGPGYDSETITQFG